MTKEEAKAQFLKLVTKYGIHWTKIVPVEAVKMMNEINQVLTESEKRAAIGREA